MASNHPHGDVAGKPEHAEASDELRRLLGLAEEIQERYEFLSRRSYFARFVFTGTAIFGLLSVYLSLLATDIPSAYVAAGASLFGVYLGAMFSLYARRLAQGLSRESRALHEVVQVVREVESAHAIEENWLPLERAEFRIRLSRFDA